MNIFFLAGGTGSRLWPMSRSQSPKQFLNLSSEKESLFQETYKRVLPLLEVEKTYVIGSQSHEILINQQVEALEENFPRDNILLEPIGRNTAPAILWGLSQIKPEHYDSPLVILPSDHQITPKEKFVEYLKQGENLCKEGKLVTFGIKPTRPDTGYGYIKQGKALVTGHEVEAFCEKPDLEKAKSFVDSGEYSWNAGIFMAMPELLIQEFKTHCPKMYDLFFDEQGKAKEIDIHKVYEQVQADSIDYAILEKSKQVATITLDLSWDDLGSWESLYLSRDKDKNGNVTQGDISLQDSQNCLVIGHKNLIAGVGLKDLIIIETDDATLICDMQKSQNIKQLVDKLNKTNNLAAQIHTTVLRPWGCYTILFEKKGVKIKSIIVESGKRLSLQRHSHRAEHWVVSKGTAVVTKGDKVISLVENESIFIPKTTVHRLENKGKLPLEIIEVQQGDYLGEDDIERLNDDFNRV